MATASSLPLYDLQEVSRHSTAKDCWIVIYDKVYNVTKFLQYHPAGAKIILKEAGKDATRKFEMFHKPESVLRLVGRPYLVGKYSGKVTTPAPLEEAKSLMKQLETDGASKKIKVAVIGGGIAGAGCAWALDKSGKYEVSLYEREKNVGGNATTYTWPAKDGSPSLTSCISVLAWPKKYFRNYEALLNGFGIKSSSHRIKFMVGASAALFRHHKKLRQEAEKAAVPSPTVRSEKAVGHLSGVTSNSSSAKFSEEPMLFFGHEYDSNLRKFFQKDLEKWSRMRAFVDKINSLFAGGAEAAVSFYAFSLFNPLNLLPLRRLAKTFGVSDLFWRIVFVPLHSSSFLTTHLNNCPAQLLPVLEDMVSLNSGGTMSSWLTTSQEVFDNLVANFEDRVYTSRQVRTLRFDLGPSKVGVVDFYGETNIYDKVVIATDAQTALTLIPNPTWLERQLLSRITFTEDLDTTFLYGQAHTDNSIFPATQRERITAEYANYIRVTDPTESHKTGGALPEHLRYENTFCLSWSPCLQASKDVKLVSYNNSIPVAPEKMGKPVFHVRDHPEFHPRNMFIALILHFIQGSRSQRLFYCGSSCTPGNGHDLSLLSGFVIADAIGAPYPFKHIPGAYSDFQLLRNMMTTSNLFTGFATKLAGGTIGLALLIKFVRKFLKL